MSARARVGAAVALAAALAAYYATHEWLLNLSLAWEVAFIALVLMPAVFALVLLALPLHRAHGLLLLGLALIALAAILEAADLDIGSNFAKLAAMTAVGFWLLGYLDSLRWVTVVAAIIPVIDAYSVWRGPTRHIVTEQREIFTRLSFAFPVPGEHGSANLGVPDLLFFAVFLAAATRFGLRVHWTWLAMALSFGATLALAVWSDAAGLPALPGLCIAFIGVNADLLWRKLRTAD